MFKSLLCSISLVVLFAQPIFAAEVLPLFSHAIPQISVDQEVEMLTVTFAPGEKSEMHRHNAHTFLYILEGSIHTQVEGGELLTLSVGDTYYENPKDIHTLADNASNDHPAKFLVFFVKATGASSYVPVH